MPVGTAPAWQRANDLAGVEVNRGHPLAVDLTMCATFGGGRAGAGCRITKQPFTPQGTSPIFGLPTSHGKGLSCESFAANGGGSYSIAPRWRTQQNTTIAWCGVLTASPSNTATFAGLHETTSNVRILTISRVADNAEFSIRWRDSFFGAAITTSSGAQLSSRLGQPLMIVAVRDCLAYVHGYLNGVRLCTSTTQIHPPDFPANIFHVGSNISGSNIIGGITTAVMMWQRPLSPAEVEQLWLEPWGIFVRPRRRIGSVASTFRPQVIISG